MTRDDVAQAIARLLRDLGTGLDDDLVARVRAILAEPSAPSPEPGVLDRGGPEPIEQHVTVEGEVRIGDRPWVERI